MTDIKIYHSTSEWSALYVDGKFDSAGDHDVVWDRLAMVLGVEQIYSNDFLLGGYRFEDVAQTVDQIREYQMDRLQRQEEADKLREQAHKLLQKAAELDGTQ